MQVGDLVVSKTGGGGFHRELASIKTTDTYPKIIEYAEVGIIVGINPNGDCKVKIKENVFLIHPQWLEVIA